MEVLGGLTSYARPLCRSALNLSSGSCFTSKLIVFASFDDSLSNTDVGAPDTLLAMRALASLQLLPHSHDSPQKFTTKSCREATAHASPYCDSQQHTYGLAVATKTTWQQSLRQLVFG